MVRRIPTGEEREWSGGYRQVRSASGQEEYRPVRSASGQEDTGRSGARCSCEDSSAAGG